MKTINLVWFKKDLRTYDNEALNAALESEIVIPILLLNQIYGKYLIILQDNENL
ncbi:deoxyribodipyrimidine photo-lyase [Prochlorococcus marinus]|uniref:Photolyase/cryptochrome alpha/beta domain-containing protein n=1 Tax=Prochlorococcus marinus str. P0902-H212 TaxID=1620696 RepID=A0A0D5A254_PROMR|nr:deoxyribodipyrimidine photo-lyase [Prochlorococcus marinus]AJW30504.1 hypothetical protein FA02_0238 [Prochlorococcus marinus str. P0902-H212]